MSDNNSYLDKTCCRKIHPHCLHGIYTSNHGNNGSQFSNIAIFTSKIICYASFYSYFCYGLIKDVQNETFQIYLWNLTLYTFTCVGDIFIKRDQNMRTCYK